MVWVAEVGLEWRSREWAAAQSASRAAAGQTKKGRERRLLQAAAAAAVAMVVYAQALAQDYPNRSIALIVPYPPGGGVDAMGRVVAEKLSAALGQQVVVDNRAGGSALVGTRALVKSPPDGYTLFLGH